MGARLITLTELFGLEDRFCSGEDRTNIKYIESLLSIDYKKKFEKYNDAKEKSELFLRVNLERMINEG